MEAIALHECLVCDGSVVISSFVEIEFAQILVDIRLVSPLAMLCKVIGNRTWATRARKAETDDTIGVFHPFPLQVIFRVLEVEAGGQLVIQYTEEPRERFLIELLLVKGPPELVEGQFVKRGANALLDDRRVGILLVKNFLSREEVFPSPELDLVVILRLGMLLDQAIHHYHRFIDVAQFFVGARHVIQDLILAMV